MNCFESRRRIAAAPRQIEEATEAHLRGCAACAAFAARLVAHDEKVETELRVPVPDGLADGVLFRVRREDGVRRVAGWMRGALAGNRAQESMEAESRGGARQAIGRRVFIAAAALAPVAVGSWLLLRRSDEDLAREVIAHVMHDEPGELALHPDGDPAALPRVLAACALVLPPDFLAVRYLARCGPPDHSGEHLVLQTPSAKVSLVLMPGYTAARRVVVTVGGAVAVLTPARVGSLAVVAPDEQTALRVAERLA